MSRRGWLLFSVMCLVWGVSYLFIKVAVGAVSVSVLVFLRTGVAALVLLPIAARAGWAPSVGAVRRHWRPASWCLASR